MQPNSIHGANFLVFMNQVDNLTEIFPMRDDFRKAVGRKKTISTKSESTGIRNDMLIVGGKTTY